MCIYVIYEYNMQYIRYYFLYIQKKTKLWEVLKLLKAKCSRKQNSQAISRQWYARVLIWSTSLLLHWLCCSCQHGHCESCDLKDLKDLLRLWVGDPLSIPQSFESGSVPKSRTSWEGVPDGLYSHMWVWVWGQRISMNFSEVQRFNISNVCVILHNVVFKVEIAESVRWCEWPTEHVCWSSQALRFKALQEPLSAQPRLHLPYDDCCGAV